MPTYPQTKPFVAQIAERLTAALLPPRRRKPGERQQNDRLSQLERDIQRERIRVGQHLAEVLCGRLDRGEDIESVTRFARVLDTELRAYYGGPSLPDVVTLSVQMTKEVGEATGAAITYANRRCESSRRVLVNEVEDARDVLDQIAIAAERTHAGAAA